MVRNGLGSWKGARVSGVGMGLKIL